MSDDVAEALHEVMPDPDGAPRMLTGWVAIATFVDTDSGKQIAFSSSEGMASWEARGLMMEVLVRHA